MTGAEQFIVGAMLVAASGCIARWRLSNGKTGPDISDRRVAIRRALVLYAATTWCLLIAAVAIGDLVVVVIFGMGALIATVGAILRWSPPDDFRS